MTAGWQWCTAIENADVIKPEKAALKDVHSISIFAIDPPREIQQQLLEDPLKENCVADSTSLLLDLVNTPRSPGVNRRIHIAKRPFVSWQLTVRVHIPFAQHQHELVLGEL